MLQQKSLNHKGLWQYLIRILKHFNIIVLSLIYVNNIHYYVKQIHQTKNKYLRKWCFPESTISLRCSTSQFVPWQWTLLQKAEKCKLKTW